MTLTETYVSNKYQTLNDESIDNPVESIDNPVEPSKFLEDIKGKVEYSKDVNVDEYSNNNGSRSTKEEKSISYTHLIPSDLDKNIINHESVNFKSIQRWEGTVTNISKNKFTALLVDLTSGGTEEELTLEKDKIDPNDIDLLEIGSTFYLNLGYHIKNKTHINGLNLRFRRLPIAPSRFYKI